jgi:hypothetical protein
VKAHSLNTHKAVVLENRLAILNKLEALIEGNPANNAPYHVPLDSFLLSGDTATALEVFHGLQNQGVAIFIFPQGTDRWNFYDRMVRIRNIDPARLIELQNDTRSRLDELNRSELQATREPLQQRESSRMRRFMTTNWKLAKIVAAAAAFLASVAIIWTFIAQLHW